MRAFLVSILGIASLAACAEIPTQHVGIVEHFGKVDVAATKDAGLSYYMPWGTGIHDMNGEVVTHRLDNMDAVTHDRQAVKTSVVVNTQLDLSKAATIYSNYRENIDDAVITPKSIETIKATTTFYDAIAQVQQRAAVQADMEKRLRIALAPYGINVVGLTITNFEYNPDYQAAIEATAVSIQNKVKAQAELQVSKIEADKAIQEARGQAQAQQELARGVSEKSLGYLFYQHWDGHFPQVTGVNGMILQIPGIGKGGD